MSRGLGDVYKRQAIMLEVHPDPENSAVDPLQPINFETFNSLMKKMDNVAKAVSKEVI